MKKISRDSLLEVHAKWCQFYILMENSYFTKGCFHEEVRVFVFEVEVEFCVWNPQKAKKNNKK
jgi:hypothetical protein